MNNAAQILILIQQLILSGGNRTMAAGLRTILNAITSSYANFVDGGYNFAALVGYNNNFTLTVFTDPRAFAHKGYVDSRIQVALYKYATYADFIAATGVSNIGDFEAYIISDETQEYGLTKVSFVNGQKNYITLQPIS